MEKVDLLLQSLDLELTCIILIYSHVVVVQLLSCVLLFEMPWTVALQAPLSMGILQARIWEWRAMPSSRGSSQPDDRTYVSCFAGSFFFFFFLQGDSLPLSCQGSPYSYMATSTYKGLGNPVVSGLDRRFQGQVCTLEAWSLVGAGHL